MGVLLADEQVRQDEIGKRLPEKKRIGSGILYPSIKLTDYAGTLLSDHRQYDFNKFLGGDN